VTGVIRTMICCVNARYAYRRFSSTKASKLRKAFLSALEEIPNCLGDLNDIAVHESLTADIAKNPAPNARATRRAFAAGVLTAVKMPASTPL
jgi:hypothetical protein